MIPCATAIWSQADLPAQLADSRSMIGGYRGHGSELRSAHLVACDLVASFGNEIAGDAALLWLNTMYYCMSEKAT